MNMHHGMAPATAGRVESKRNARASVILDEAMAILATEGLDSLTLGRLAKALGYVPAALYRYFDSKDALLAALQRRAVTAIHVGLGEASRAVEQVAADAPPGAAALAKLLGAARFYLALPETEPEAAFLIALMTGDPRPLLSDEESRRTAPLLVALLADVEAMFTAAERASVLAKGDSIERTLVFWSVLSGALSLHKMRRITDALPPPSQIGTFAVQSLLAGWGAPPGELKRAAQLVATGEKKTTDKSTRSDGATKRASGTKKART